jgi:hypothetical protein
MDAEINNVIYMELYSGAKMVDDEYYKTNVARLIDRDSTVLCQDGWRERLRSTCTPLGLKVLNISALLNAIL